VHDSTPDFAPDGRRVAYAAGNLSGYGIFAVNIDGSGRGRLTTEVNDREPEYSPDGKRIAFLRGYDLYVMAANGHRQRRLRGGWSEIGPPSWTPDGKSIVVSASGGELYPLYLYTLDARTGRIERQTLLQDNDGDPGPDAAGRALLSPDGHTVVFTGNKETCNGCDPAYTLFRKGFPRGPVRRVGDWAVDGWSADSRVLVTGAGRPAIYLRVLRDGRTRLVPVGGNVVAEYAALQPR
jgi:Tol biopolymer transport system component